MLPRLLATKTDVCAQKILIAAKAAGVELKLEAPKSKSGVPELIKGDQVIRYTNAILRFVGRIYEGGDIYGSNFMETAQVDSWLDWTEMELGTAKPPRMTEALEVLERHLANRVFLVGQRFTLADASLSCSLSHFHREGVAPKLERATARWLGTCTAQDAFVSVVGAVSVVSSSSKGAPAGAKPAQCAPAAAKPAVVQAAAPAAVAQSNAMKAGAAGAALPLVASYSSCVGGRTQVKRIVLAEDGGKSLIGQKISVCGWVRTTREAAKGALVFAELNDGSCQGSLQAVIASKVKGFASLKGQCGTGASLKCTGKLVASQGKGQAVELLVDEDDHEVVLYGGVDAKEYPLAKKAHTNEYLRSIAHLRPRSSLLGSVARVRSALCQATHEFFRDRGFQYIHTPLITAADCEGAGEMFQVTTLLHDAEKDNLKLPKNDEGKIDYSKDFFGKPTFMTVSGQLSVEAFCCALSSVYTFGPCFRAENSHTSRHLAEFWMIEPELAFADLADDMDCAEDYLKYCVKYAMDHNLEDLQFFDEKVEKGLVKRLENLLAEPFARVTYTEGVEILIKESPKANFLVPVEWGMDLGSEHERYLCEKVFNKPTILYNYPKDIKAFYMRLNEDGKTVAAMDVLAPAIGEVIGGSQREERLDVLDRRTEEMGLDPKDYWWYRDLRRFGSVPHCGFGLGLERLIMLTTGVDNIRDVIPYPRYPGHAEF